MKRILVPVDGSDSSLLAEQTAIMIAKKTGAIVTALHVIREVEAYYRLLYAAQGLEESLPESIIKEILEFTEQEAGKVVNDAQALFNKEGISGDSRIIKGIDPADSIIEFSKKDYDLIIIGSRGKNEKDPYALGSVTKKVIRYATCPTLVAKKHCDISNLLVCIDGSEHSIKALDFAVKLAEKARSKLRLLNVMRVRGVHVTLSPHAEAVFGALGRQILSNALCAVGKEELKAEKSVEFGVISDSIVEVAEKENHDLIVLGSRGLGTVRRFLLGSVSDKVSLKAKCSVLIFPAKHE